jgi:hypothetical protein
VGIAAASAIAAHITGPGREARGITSLIQIHASLADYTVWARNYRSCDSTFRLDCSIPATNEGCLFNGIYAFLPTICCHRSCNRVLWWRNGI